VGCRIRLVREIESFTGSAPGFRGSHERCIIGYKVRKTPTSKNKCTSRWKNCASVCRLFRPELIHLKGLLEENSPAKESSSSLNLRLPSGQMAAQKKASTPSAAVKAAFERSAAAGDPHKDLLRSSHKWPRWRRGAETLRAADAFEDTLASVQAPLVSGEDIRKYVNVNLSRLERFVNASSIFVRPRNRSRRVGHQGRSHRRSHCSRAGRRRREARAARSRTLAIPARLALHGRHGPGRPQHNGSVHLEDSARQRNVRASDEAELQFHSLRSISWAQP